MDLFQFLKNTDVFRVPPTSFFGHSCFNSIELLVSVLSQHSLGFEELITGWAGSVRQREGGQGGEAPRGMRILLLMRVVEGLFFYRGSYPFFYAFFKGSLSFLRPFLKEVPILFGRLVQGGPILFLCLLRHSYPFLKALLRDSYPFSERLENLGATVLQHISQSLFSGSFRAFSN